MDEKIIIAWLKQKKELENLFTEDKSFFDIKKLAKSINDIIFEKGEIVDDYRCYKKQTWSVSVSQTGEYYGDYIIVFTSTSSECYISRLEYGSCACMDALYYANNITNAEKKVKALMLISLHIIQQAKPVFTEEQKSILGEIEDIAGDDISDEI